jgi:hypothetical protein
LRKSHARFEAATANQSETKPLDNAPKPEPALEAAPMPEPEPVFELKPLSPGEEYWMTAHHDLRLRMAHETFDNWLKRAKLISFENEIFTLGVESQMAVDWLEMRLKGVILKTLKWIVGREVGVEFVVLADVTGQEKDLDPGVKTA